MTDSTDDAQSSDVQAEENAAVEPQSEGVDIQENQPIVNDSFDTTAVTELEQEPKGNDSVSVLERSEGCDTTSGESCTDPEDIKESRNTLDVQQSRDDDGSSVVDAPSLGGETVDTTTQQQKLFSEETKETDSESQPETLDDVRFTSTDDSPGVVDDNGPKYTAPAPLEVPTDAIQYSYAYGYECRRHGNLLALPNTAVYIAGHVVVLHNVNTREQEFLPAAGAGGVGALALHPSQRFFAVGEKGDNPDINIYEYPSKALHRVLRSGTLKGYACLSFNANGDKLASVGMYPDFMLTVWDWRNEATILRTKAFSSDIWRVSFAPENDGQLTTCGVGHIRFWKMAETFTGLKLQGDIGKFGKAEISDVAGCVELADGKVVSGSEWGNLILWEGGKIKCEIARPGKVPCHAGGVDVVVLEDGEIVTAGADGHVRMWDLDTIDLADQPSETDLVFEMEPQLERKVGVKVHVKSMSKTEELGEDDTKSVWYVQDGNGGIWRVDLAQSMTTPAPVRLVHTHAGAVMGVATCPRGHFAVTGGKDGTVRVFDYLRRQTLAKWSADIGATRLAWAPPAVDASGRTFFVGFADGVLRVFRFSHGAAGTTLVLHQVWKPHTSDVRAIACSADGTVVATADAHHVFFFECSHGALDPVGFVRVDAENETAVAGRRAEINSMRFDPRQKRVVLSCSDGTVREVVVPERAAHDTASTYHLSSVAARVYTFKSIVAKLQAAAEAASKPKAKGKKPAAADGGDGGDGSASDAPSDAADGDVERADADTDAKQRGGAGGGPSAMLDAWHTERDTMMVLAGGRDAQYVYECSFDTDEPMAYFPLPGATVVAVTGALAMGTHVALWARDGSLRIHEAGDLSRARLYHLHTADALEQGGVTAVAASFDGAFLLTAGTDGNVFVLRSGIGGHVADVLASEELEHISSDVAAAEDILDPKHYSIEQAKQQAEADLQAMTADEKKAEVRKQVRLLRKEFDTLVKENSALPLGQQLSRADFEMDPEIGARIAEQQAAQRAQLTAEMAWTLERHTLAHEKLRRRFLDRVRDPLYVIKCIRGTEQVSTYRLIEPSSEFLKLSEDISFPLARMKALANRARGLVAQRRLDSAASSAATSSRGDDGAGPLVTPATAPRDPSLAKASEQAALRQQMRERRKAEWDALNGRKPNPTEENPHDLAEIAAFQANMGDYKLKKSPTYTVPVDDRVNTVKKRTQIISLRQRIYDAKETFNAYVAKVRKAKRGALADIATKRTQLISVLAELGQPIEVIMQPMMDEEEEPERLMKYTKESLWQFKKDFAIEQEAEAAKAAAARSAGGFGGLGGGGGDGAEGGTEAGTDGGTERGGASGDSVQGTRLALVTLPPPPTVRAMDDRLAHVARPAAYHALARKRTAVLQAQRDSLQAQINTVIDDFDAKVRVLLSAKRETEVRIKFAEFQHVVYYRELVHLKAFDIREDAIEKRRDIKLFEKKESVKNRTKAQKEYDTKKKLVTQLNETLKQAQSEFVSNLGENHKFERYLTKVFKRKVKRRKPGDASDSDGESESDDSEDDSDFDSDGDDDEDFDDTVAPPGCDVELFNRTLALRDRRLDAEEALVDEKKATDLLKKEVDMQTKKEKTIAAALLVEEETLAALQLEKQGKLNELDTAVPLRLDQIYYYTNHGTLPASLEDSLIFPVPQMERLKDRIAELTKMQQLQKQDRRAIKKERARLQGEMREKEHRAAELDQKVKDLMMLKFGALVDLEALDKNAGINMVGEDLRATIQDLEKEYARLIKEWDGKVVQAKRALDTAITRNTGRLQDLSTLTAKHSQLTVALEGAQKEVLRDDSAATQARDLDERRRLKMVADAQAEEIAMLRHKLTQFHRKGGGDLFVTPDRPEPLPPIGDRQ